MLLSLAPCPSDHPLSPQHLYFALTPVSFEEAQSLAPSRPLAYLPHAQTKSPSGHSLEATPPTASHPYSDSRLVEKLKETILFLTNELSKMRSQRVSCSNLSQKIEKTKTGLIPSRDSLFDFSGRESYCSLNKNTFTKLYEHPKKSSQSKQFHLTMNLKSLAGGGDGPASGATRKH